MRTHAGVALLAVGSKLALAQSITTSFKTVVFQPILLDVTVAEWDLFDHENALYLTCPHQDLVVDPGPVLYDASGHPVWMNTSAPFSEFQCYDANVQTYNGLPYLTMWLGTVAAAGYGNGSGVLLDSSFNIVETINAGNGLSAGERTSSAIASSINADETFTNSIFRAKRIQPRFSQSSTQYNRTLLLLD